MGEGERVDLTEILGQNIALEVEAADWRGAVRAVGALLVDAGCVGPEYVEAMLRVVETLGPYAVVAPGVALPHARPEDGVKRPGMALARLRHPVNFGSSVNDPVDIVVCFAAMDREAHLGALASLADVLADEARLAALRRACSVEEVREAMWGCPRTFVRGGEE